MTATTDTAPLDLDEPVPYALTPKASDYLDRLARAAAAALVDGALAVETAIAGAALPDCLSEWACERCGSAWFGTQPDDGLCPGCRDGR